MNKNPLIRFMYMHVCDQIILGRRPEDISISSRVHSIINSVLISYRIRFRFHALI